MNNLKKVGLTALATSMIASSAAYAGEMSVSGSASLKYTGLSTASDVTHSQWVTVSTLLVVVILITE
jgi:hypothetical protein